MKVSIVSQFRDEAKFLKEWIEFHLMVGFDNFYLINHLSKDNHLEVLQPYIDRGIVHLTDLSVETNNGKNSYDNEVLLVKTSIPLFNKVIRESVTDWFIFLNVDEFLYPVNNDNIKNVINTFPSNVGQIGVNWRMMGNSGYRLNDGELITEKLTKSKIKDTGDNWDEQRHVKCLVRKDAFDVLQSVHFCKLKPNYLYVDSNNNPSNINENVYHTNIQVLDNIAINHYVFRDLNYTEVKINTYKSWGREFTDEESYKSKYNDVENLEVHKFLPALKERMGIK
jgi:hypothetical protein